MNTIYIEKSAYSYLREWAEKDRLKCSLAEPFFKKCEIRKKDNPEGVFQVRGHFRRYQTGKVIWIDGFMKGVDKIDNN